jgi:hypothetical protein
MCPQQQEVRWSVFEHPPRTFEKPMSALRIPEENANPVSLRLA